MDPRFHTKNEAAAILRVPPSRVDRLIRDGSLVSVKIGRSRRIPRDAIEAFIASLAERA